MVSDFECMDCNLNFSVGGYHLHDFSDGYGGVLLAICSCCAIQHKIIVALEDRGPEFYEIFRVSVEEFPPQSKASLMLRLHKMDREVKIEEVARKISKLPFVYKESLAESQAHLISKDLARIGVKVTIAPYDKRPNPVFGPKRSNILSWKPKKNTVNQGANEVNEWISVESILPVWLEEKTARTLASACQSCGGIGTLLTDWRVQQGCPSCLSKLIRLKSEWMT
ncbi:hypothetical protein [Acidovorax sacchari]|uniref:hypothetical protein n=1 Tax=Acidovorax sacchari TaxID=3230736 RepID=UPI0039E5ED57